MNISLNHAGTYTLVINPDDMTLTIEWPTPDYQLSRRKPNANEYYQIPFVYNEETKTWTIAEPQYFEDGDELWITDEQSGQGWGLNSGVRINKGNSTNLYFMANGFVTSIDGSCPYALNFTLKEDPTSGCLIANITGWPETGYYLYYSNGWAEAASANYFQPGVLPGSFTLTRKELKNEANDNSYRFGILHIDDEGNQTYYAHSDAEATIVPQADGSTTYPLTAYEGTPKMFQLEPGIYTFDIVDGALKITEKEPMYSVIANGDIEGDDMSCFFKKEGVDNDIVQVAWTAGAGKNGSRGIVVQSRDLDNQGDRWDTQFFVRANQTLPAGTKYRLAFDYKASNNDAASEAQAHAEPGEYIYYHFPVTPTFTTEWQHFELEGEITQDQSPTDNMRTIAIFLAVYPEATTYYFDNIQFEIDEAHVAHNVLMGDVNGDGVVNIQDVVALVDHTLGKEVSMFVEEAADVTGDGQINISDVVAVVNILLGKGN